MATKLNGKLNLSKIPAECIFADNNGDKCVYIDVIPVKNGKDRFDNTHFVSIYNKATGKNAYVANLKTQDFGTPTNANQPINK